MAFIQPCFIRKNTPELRKTLEALGYKASFGNINNDSIATSSITNTYSCISMSIFDNENPHINWKANGKRIDCGDNEDLFFALAALRDDTDINQYFICDKVSFTLGKTYYPDDYLYYQYDEFFDKQNLHKATVEEIIEHFNK